MKKPRKELGREVKTVQSLHSNITAGMVGTIEQVLPDGYGVYYPATQQTQLFGGGTVTIPAIVFMRENDVTYNEQV